MVKKKTKKLPQKAEPKKANKKVEKAKEVKEVDVKEPEAKEPEVKEPKKKTTDPLKLYFNSDTQRAIVDFQSAKTKKDRDQLYVKEIMPAFEKLVENLINIHKFAGLYDSYDDLKNDCVNFLFETIGKFDASRGTNAFSYFNVVAKNWLIIKTKQKSQKTKKNVSLDDPSTLSAHEKNIVEEHCTLPSQDILFESAKSTETITAALYEIREKVRTENELICINSIITIFENIDEIDLLNKNAILLYMRELSGLSPKQLTTTMQAIKKHYRKIKIEQRDEL